MNLTELREHLRQDPEFVKAETELRPYFQFGDDVIILRLDRGWSQSELARHAGTDQSNISRVESALANPTIAFMQRIADALDAELMVRLRKREDLPECVLANTRTGSTDRAIPVANWPRSAEPGVSAPHPVSTGSQAVVTRVGI